MDEATYETIGVLSGSVAAEIEYWHKDQQDWFSSPPVSSVRVPGLVHEASTLFMHNDSDVGSVDSDYKVHGTQNVVCHQFP